jgi:thiosulfate/3-mercaptopyruvate sulfurtransferase
MSNLISAHELYDSLNDPDLVIVDVRFDLKSPEAGRHDYEAGHIPNAVYLALEPDLSGPAGAHGGRHPLPEVEVFARILERAGISNGSRVVVYDASAGMFAGRLWWMLKYLGHDRVQLLDGGYPAWLEAGYPTSRNIPAPPMGTFKPQPQPHLVAGVVEVRDALQDPSTLLVDARGADRYRGENETMDKKAGHIPSALNLPFAENLAGGKFKDAAALKERFAGLEEAEEVIVYCGSGVSAAHDLLAMEEAGITGAKLYVGSWSDWSSYDDNPVATGDEP